MKNLEKYFQYACKNCSTDFYRLKSDVKFRKNKNPNFEPEFCSRKCMHEYKKKNIVYHDFICLSCGHMFQRSEREIKNSNSKGIPIKFCCRKCKDNYWGRNQITVNCSNCNLEFKVQQKFKNKKHHFCSSKCCNEFNINNNLRNTVSTLICKKCGKKFNVKNSYLRKQTKRGQSVVYCSNECRFSDFNNFKKKYDFILDNLVCHHCGKKISKGRHRIKLYLQGKYKHIYCSSNCQHEAKNKRSIINCDFCGKEYEIKNHKLINHNKHFCCNDHKKKYYHKLKETYADISHYLRTCSLYEKWKNFCLNRDNYTCQDCGSRSNIIVHHINELYSICKKYDFNIENIKNSFEFNDVNNGISLCKKCHMKKHPWIKDEKGKFVSNIASSLSTDSEDND